VRHRFSGQSGETVADSVEEGRIRLVLLKVRGDGAAGRRTGAAYGKRRRSVPHGGPGESPPGEREVPLS